jgi:beta-glucosidase
VTNWFTINEPQVFIGAGLQGGRHAPGDKLAFAEVTQAAHHVMLAHGLSAQTIRARAKTPPKVAIAPVSGNAVPASDSPSDIEAARKQTFSVKTRDMWQNTWWWDPLFLGRYPEDGLALFGADAPRFTEEDMKTICQPMDYLGVNIYYGSYIQATDNALGWKEAPYYVGHPQTAFRWFVMPETLYWTPRFFYERYGKPIVITENGLSNQDWIHLDGKVHDPQRIDFLHRYLRELKRAISDGTDVAGYFQWSLMDNFEWAEGYKERFGLIYVDYRDQRRIPKDSFYWYQGVIANNGADL